MVLSFKVGTEMLVKSINQQIKGINLIILANASQGIASKINIDEAQKILNITSNSKLEDIKARYSHLFNANSVENGGSFYIQSKVYRAYEAVMKNLHNNLNP